jgi:hypothetical protein
MKRVVTAANPLGLVAGSEVEEVSRREVWEHQGCIPSVRTVMVELRLPSGEVREELLEQGYADAEPWSGPDAWLEEVV